MEQYYLNQYKTNDINNINDMIARDIDIRTLARPGPLQCSFNPQQANAATDAAAVDYEYKSSLTDNARQKLSVWASAHWGETYTAGVVAEYKSLTDNAVQAEVNYRASGQTYRALLESLSNCYSTSYNQSEIDRVDRNNVVSNNNQAAYLSNYQIVTQRYQQQLEEERRIQEEMKKREQARIVIDKALSDYSWKGSLKDEGTQRLSMWEAAHWGDTFFTYNTFYNYKTLTDDAIQREKNFRASGQAYKKLLVQYSDLFDNSAEIDRVDHNDAISNSDQKGEIYNFQQIEAKYLNQEELERVGGGGLVAIFGLSVLAWGIGKLAKMGKEKVEVPQQKKYRGFIEVR